MNTEYVIEYLFVNIFWIYLIYRYMKLFFQEQKTSKNVRIPVYIGFYFINSFTNLYFNSPLCNILTSLLGIYVIATLYQSHISKKIVASLMIYIVSMICDTIIATLVGDYIIGMRMNVINNVISYLLIFTVELLIEKYMHFRSGYIQKKHHVIAIMGVPVSSMVIILTLVFSRISMKKIVILISFVLLLINFLVMYLYEMLLKDYDQTYHARFLEQEVSAYREQLELIDSSQKMLASLRHDMKHHLLSILYMANSGETEKIQEYVGKMIEMTINKKEYVLSGNSDIDSILNYMIQKAKDKGIEVRTSIKIATQMKVDCFDLNVILGNLLENAIEATEKTSNKYIQIGLQLERNVIFIEIENSYVGKLIKSGKKLSTTKMDKKNHGLGIENVKSVLNKYNGEIHIEFDDSTFKVNAMMYLSTR